MNMKVKLTRTGRAPLEFDGEIIAEVSTHNLRGNDQNRWYEIKIYKTGQQHISHVAYRTKWQGELDHDWSDAYDDPRDLTMQLVDLVAIPTRIGWPPRKEFESRQQALLDDLRSQYGYAVSKVLEGFPEVL